MILELMRRVEASVERLAADVRDIQLVLAEKRGERRVALWLAGAAGAGGAMVPKLLTWAVAFAKA